MMTAAAERFLVQHKDLPTMPEVASRLLKSFDDDNVGLAQIAALIEKDGALTAKVLRLANSDVLPFEFSSVANTVEGYVREISKLADDMREQTAERNRLIADGSLAAVADPSERYVVPKPLDAVPPFDFGPLRTSVARLKESATRYSRAEAAASARGTQVEADQRKRLDEILMGVERALTRAEGLPRRPWYVHYVYAPGNYTGYGVKTLPSVREAIEVRNWTEASAQIGVVASVLDGYSKEIDRASELLEKFSSRGSGS